MMFKMYVFLIISLIQSSIPFSAQPPKAKKLTIEKEVKRLKEQIYSNINRFDVLIKREDINSEQLEILKKNGNDQSEEIKNLQERSEALAERNNRNLKSWAILFQQVENRNVIDRFLFFISRSRFPDLKASETIAKYTPASETMLRHTSISEVRQPEL